MSLKRLKSGWLPIVLVGWMVFSGCPQERDEPCPAIWIVETSQLAAKAEVRLGDLSIEALSAEPGVAVSVYQDGLSGDFNITADFDAFTPGTGTGGYAQMIVYDPLQPQAGISGTAIANGRIESFVGYPGGLTDSRLINGSQGTMKIERTGERIIATCTVGNDQSEKVLDFLSSDLRVAFQVGSNDTTLTGTTGIRIQEFTVTGGEGISSDDFSCDSYL